MSKNDNEGTEINWNAVLETLIAELLMKGVEIVIREAPHPTDKEERSASKEGE